MRIKREPAIQVKTRAQLGVMREAGLVVAHALSMLAAAAEPGVTTAELDADRRAADHRRRSHPLLQGLPRLPRHHLHVGERGDRARHPEPGQAARTGDVISIDCGAIVRGWHADAALTVGVGEISEELPPPAHRLRGGAVARAGQARPGRRLTDISHAVETSARAAGPYGIVEEYVGHGIGTEMHMDPAVPNYGRPGRGPVLTAGMALAVEPMLVLGDRHTRLLDDGWTVVSSDGTPAAHFEHTVAITADGPWVLTAADGGQGTARPGLPQRPGPVHAAPTRPPRGRAERAAPARREGSR